MAIYDFEDAVYPYDLANAKIENSWYWANLAQYANTPYNLTIRPNGASSNLLEHSNDIYGWVNNNGESNSYAFKLKRNSLITKITADVRLVSYVNNIPVGFIIMPFYLDTSGTFAERIADNYNYIQRDNGSYEIAQNHTVHITDDGWHSVEFPTDGSDISTHIQIYCVTNRSIEIKNIKIEGYAIDESPSGGAGSGYIGNSLLDNKKMVGYNVPTSSAKGTKTESVNEFSANPVANKPKAGNGHAKIKFLKECTEKYIDNLMVTDTLNNVENKSTAQWGSPFHLNEWDNNLFRDSIGNGHTLHGASPNQNQSNIEYDSANKQFTLSKNIAGSDLTEGWLIPLQKNQDIYKVTFDVQLVACQGHGWDTSLIGFVSIASGSFSTKLEKNILWMNNQTGETGEHITDYNWHTFSYNLNLKNISYFGFSCANNQCKFKNVKIVCCDSD